MHTDTITNNTPTSRPTGFTPDFELSLANAETLVRDMKKLLAGSDSALQHQNIRTEMETLERWMESYRRGLSAANKISQNGPELMKSIRDRLKLAVEELQRLEGEGGNPAAEAKEAAEVEDLLKTSRRLEKLIPAIETMFCKCEEPKTETQPADTRISESA